VICGRVYNGKITAIVPYLFADDSYNNKILFENIIRWLLGLPIPKSINVPVELKSIAEERNRLIKEIEELNALKERLLNETEMLKQHKEEYIKSLPEYQELLKLREKVSELENKTVELEQFKLEVEKLHEELQRVYFVTGLPDASCIIIGFIIEYKLWSRKS